MSRLKHILKLILLGPQPKDEWYEEWSKDPLAEWFQEQSAGTSRESKWRILWRNLTADRLMRVLTLGWLLGVWLLPDDLRYINHLGALVLFLFLISGWKSRKRKNRPSGRLVDLFFPAAHESAVIDIWSCGFKGRDMVRLAYLQRAVGISFLEMIAFLSMFIAISMLVSAWGELPQAAALIVLLVVVQNNECGYCFHRNAYPFRIWFWPSTGLDLPGVRAIKQWDLSGSDDIMTRLAVPLWPLFAVPLIVYWMLQGVTAGHYSQSAGFVGFFLVVAFSVVLMNVFARGRRASDLEYVEDALTVADEDFDQWVRTELIGDEDARR